MLEKVRPVNRLDKVNSLLLRELNTFLQRERIAQKDPQKDIILSITRVGVSKDLKYAKVFFSVLPLKFRGDAKTFLEKMARRWQRDLGEKITLKYIPHLRFFYDEGQQNALTVEEILQKIKTDQQQYDK